MTSRQKYRSSPRQPLDRHLSEIGEVDGTVYINAGIDSTCCKKRSQTIHKLTDGIIVSTIKSEHHNDLSPVLSNSRTNDDRCDTVTNVHCTHCGK